MELFLLTLAVALMFFCLILLILLLRRRSASADIEPTLKELAEKTNQAMLQNQQSFAHLSEQSTQSASLNRQELSSHFKDQNQTTMAMLGQISKDSRQGLSEVRQEMDRQLLQMQEESRRQLRDMQHTVDEKLSQTLSEGKNQNQAAMTMLGQMSKDSREGLAEIRQEMDQRLLQMQEENRRQLRDMQHTVDEKLTQTLSEGLDRSFETVGKQLEQVYRSMGEMQTMTADIVDLKRILANVKNRGTWGEVQLESLLSDLLTTGQYEAQFSLSGGREKVDFAIRLPGTSSQPVYLPIDAKFPMDRYQAVLDAQQSANPDALKAAVSALHRMVLDSAKSIRDKYITPPTTTDFAILFVPSEGLYAQLCADGLPQTLQQQFRILLAGPSVLSALLSSLQVGFKTVAIEQRSAEILTLLSAVKTAFGRFSTSLESVQKSLNAASNNLNRAASNSRSIQRSLKNVEMLPEDKARTLLGDDLFLEE